MKISKFEDRDAWMDARRGKITGSRLKDIIVLKGTGEKKGFYELIAERIGSKRDGERPMDRGTRLETEAIAKFSEVTGKKVSEDLVIWMRDDEESIAVSPDGVVSEEEAVEVKCLSSASHIEAYITQQVPKEYVMQTIQYFIVNDALTTLHVVFYDPSLAFKDYFVIEIKRQHIEPEIEEYLSTQRAKLQSVKDWVTKLTEF